MIRILMAVSKASFFEVIRQPVHLLVTIGTLALFALSPRLAMFALREELSLMKDFGVSMLLLSALVQATFAASNIVRREIETRTTLMLFAKPVSRELFLTGKFLGVLGAVGLSVLLYTIALLLAARQGPPTSVRHPTDWPVVVCGFGAFLASVGWSLWRFARLGRPIGSTFHLVASVSLGLGWVVAAFFGKAWELQAFGEGFDSQIARAAFMSFCGLTVLIAFAVSVSVWIGRGGTFVVTIALFLIGLRWSGAMIVLTDFRLFWAGNLFFSRDASLPTYHLAQIAVYAMVQGAAYLLVGCFLLRRKGL